MIDLITVHPRSVDFPWWRNFVTNNRKKFGKVIVVMTQKATDLDVTDTLRKTVPNIKVIDNMEFKGNSDWRDVATNMAIDQSDAQRILFMEQDMLVRDEHLDKALNHPISVSFMEGARVHPAFFLVDREIVNKTSRNFSANPPHGDHFYEFTKEVLNMSSWSSLSDLGVSHLHMAGTTQNYTVGMLYPEQLYRPTRFYAYNSLNLQNYQPDPSFKSLMEAIQKNKPPEMKSDWEPLMEFFP